MIGDKHVVQCSILGVPAFRHYGTEIANGAIVDNSWRYGYRRVDSLAEMAGGRPTWVEESNATLEQRLEAARRAESMIGHCYAYSLLGNNCEHFANWCRTGVAFSQQVIDGLRTILGAALMAAGVILLAAGFSAARAAEA
jgi:hypothetical protein